MGPEATNLETFNSRAQSDGVLPRKVSRAIGGRRGDQCSPGRKCSPEANHLFPELAPMLKLLRRHEFYHVQVVGRWLEVLTQREDIHAHILRGTYQ